MFKILFTQIICNSPMSCDVLHDMLIYEYSSEESCRSELIDYADRNFNKVNEKVTFKNTDRGFIAKITMLDFSNYSQQIECINVSK